MSVSTQQKERELSMLRLQVQQQSQPVLSNMVLWISGYKMYYKTSPNVAKPCAIQRHAKATPVYCSVGLLPSVIL